MTLADAQQLRLLDRLRRAGTQSLALGELRASGIDFSAGAISELELHGSVIGRVYDNGWPIGVRVLEPTPPIRRPSQRRWRRSSRSPAPAPGQPAAPEAANTTAGGGRPCVQRPSPRRMMGQLRMLMAPCGGARQRESGVQPVDLQLRAGL